MLVSVKVPPGPDATGEPAGISISLPSRYVIKTAGAPGKAEAVSDDGSQSLMMSFIPPETAEMIAGFIVLDMAEPLQFDAISACNPVREDGVAVARDTGVCPAAVIKVDGSPTPP